MTSRNEKQMVGVFVMPGKNPGGMLTTQDKHNLVCQKVARLKVSLAQGMILRERLRYPD